jgi:hypothetical protein
VRAITIDGLAKEFGPPVILSLDIYEIAPLKGASETLKAQATWFIEVHGNAILSKYGCGRIPSISGSPDRPGGAVKIRFRCFSVIFTR